MLDASRALLNVTGHVPFCAQRTGKKAGNTDPFFYPFYHNLILTIKWGAMRKAWNIPLNRQNQLVKMPYFNEAAGP
jgi:hypothetical protein